MITCFPIVVLAAALLPVFQSHPPQKAAMPQQYLVHIAQGVDTSHLSISSRPLDIYGKALCISQQFGRKAVQDYSVLWGSGKPEIGDEAEDIQLIIHVPGYKIITTQVKARQIASTPFEPAFEKLPTVPLTLKILNTNGKAAAGEKITLLYDLNILTYFNVADGPGVTAVLLEAITDSAGQIQVRIPVFEEDPYFQKYSKNLFCEDWYCGLILGTGGQTSLLPRNAVFRPGHIPVLHSYPDPIVVTRIHGARLRGSVKPSFLRRNTIEGDLTPYTDANRGGQYSAELTANVTDGSAGYNCNLIGNGRFSVNLPVGSFDLILTIHDGGKIIKSVMIRENLTLRESEDCRITIK